MLAGVEDQNDDTSNDYPEVHLQEIKTALAFIDALKTASLDNGGLDNDTADALRHPPEHLLDVSDRFLRLSIDLFLSVSNASQETYNTTRNAIIRCFPESEPELLTYARAKTKISQLSGVVPIMHHMCINTCLSYTGPFEELEMCPTCGEPRYDQGKLDATNGRVKVPRREFHTIPLGPQIQALWRTPESARAMQHRARRTAAILTELEENQGTIPVYDDFYHGADYIEAVQAGKISDNDTVLMLSMDGAQLYQSKASDCWIYIWVIFDLAPDKRYKKKHVLPGAFIPGPNKPKNVDSFLFPGLHHLAALQREGLAIWNALDNTTFTSHPYFALGTADGPGMTYLNGLVGHVGAYGCRLYCPIKGRRKPGSAHYCPALLKPTNYNVAGCCHDDVDAARLPKPSINEYLFNLAHLQRSYDEKEYAIRRKDTGISKPSIFSGLPPHRCTQAPRCFPCDVMHLASINAPDLLLALWRGTLACDPTDNITTWDWAVLKGDVWKRHGQSVADATHYLPGSFDRPPRNPAEKMSSGYKAWEFLMYVFALGPALFHGILPTKYWANFCKLAAALRILHQRSIPREQLLQANKLMVEFNIEFENIYYQRRVDRLHFCRPSIHGFIHLATQVPRTGPPSIFSQWPMERTIGNLGEEIKQPSNPFANLSQRGVRRSQVNALKAMIPDLEPEADKLPRASIDIGDGFVLLRPKDTAARPMADPEGEAFSHFLEAAGAALRPGGDYDVTKWGRLRLPNSQIARSAWKETRKAINQIRMSRNVKVRWCILSKHLID